MAAVCDESCFPNPFFTPDDVTVTPKGTISIDLSNDAPIDNDQPSSPPPLLSPTLEHELFGSDSSESDDVQDRAVLTRYADDIRLDPPVFPYTIYSVVNMLAAVCWFSQDDLLGNLFGSLLGGTEADYKFPAQKLCIYQLPNGSYTIYTHYLDLFYGRLRTCAGLIFTAMNNHPVDIRGLCADYISVTLPRLALEQTGLIFPSIGLLLGRKHRRHIKATALHPREASLCNPGAGVNMSLEEWLGRTTGPAVWSVQLEAWLDRYLSNNRNIRGADSSCSYLCSEQGFDVFFVVEGNEKE
ncbi:hypothetical protein R3P38DRAFT_2812225 [Favolaschia claudopus]|uniref:Uncharacterized protein n=1 Tax=Favolaschia claudopus TaxID=2862362 RepID=A0AAV9Z764_9AGAR